MVFADELLELAMLYVEGGSIEKDSEKGLCLLEELGKSGDIRAWQKIGSFYADDEAQNDDDEAFKYFLIAAEAGDAEAQNNLATFYYYGRGTESDLNKAIQWYRKSMGNGYELAGNSLGKVLSITAETEAEENEALRLLKQAVERGDSNAAFALGQFYYSKELLKREETGKGEEPEQIDSVQVDLREDIFWFRKAMKLEDTNGCAMLGYCYLFDQSDGSYFREGIELLQKAVVQDSAEAQCWLGLAYYVGHGVPKNDLHALKWFLIAAANGNEDARMYRETLQSELPKKVQIEAQQLAFEWKPIVEEKENGHEESNLISDK